MLHLSYISCSFSVYERTNNNKQTIRKLKKKTYKSQSADLHESLFVVSVCYFVWVCEWVSAKPVCVVCSAQTNLQERSEREAKIGTLNKNNNKTFRRVWDCVCVCAKLIFAKEEKPKKQKRNSKEKRQKQQLVYHQVFLPTTLQRQKQNLSFHHRKKVWQPVRSFSCSFLSRSSRQASKKCIQVLLN